MNQARLTLEDLLGDTPLLVGVGVILLLDVPDHEGLVSGARDEEFFSLISVDDLANLHSGHPTTVT